MKWWMPFGLELRWQNENGEEMDPDYCSVIFADEMKTKMINISKKGWNYNFKSI